MTDQTHSSPASLLEELSEIRKLKFSLDREEFLDGMIALAVPVTDNNGRYVASLAMHGPTQRLSIDHLVSQVGHIQNTAKQLSKVLFSQ